MAPPDITAELTRLATPIGLVLAGLSYAKRKEAIGGWLMFFFCTTYTGLLVLLMANVRTIAILFPAPPVLPPQNAGPLMLAVLPRLFGFIAVAIVATVLLKLREWVWVGRLRFALGLELVMAGISLVVDRMYFPDAFLLNLGRWLVMGAWFVYFCVSERVRTTFSAPGYG